jgi:hypothetical protein
MLAGMRRRLPATLLLVFVVAGCGRSSGGATTSGASTTQLAVSSKTTTACQLWRRAVVDNDPPAAKGSYQTRDNQPIPTQFLDGYDPHKQSGGLDVSVFAFYGCSAVVFDGTGSTVSSIRVAVSEEGEDQGDQYSLDCGHPIAVDQSSLQETSATAAELARIDKRVSGVALSGCSEKAGEPYFTIGDHLFIALSDDSHHFDHVNAPRALVEWLDATKFDGQLSHL